MTSILWLLYLVAILSILAAALRFFDRTPRVVSFRVALAWTGFWMMLALSFSFVVHYVYEQRVWGFGLNPAFPQTGSDALLAFLGAYFIETCLHLDNVFAMALIFSHYGIRLRMQYRVLYWGVLAALLVRGGLIGACGATFLYVPWFHVALGGALVLSMVRLLIARHDRFSKNGNLLVWATRKIFPAATTSGGHFFVREDGRWKVTSLFIALVLIETADVVYALDSIPAAFVITRDPFLIFTSNVFAILGMRSMYFALMMLIDRFYYLRTSLVVVLAFMTMQMFLLNVMRVPIPLTMGVVGAIMAAGVVGSLRSKKWKPEPLVGPLADDIDEYARLTWRQARKVIVLVVGSTLMLIGVAMILLPGPAFVVIPTGLALLATEFVWARRLFNRLKHETGGIISYLRHFTFAAPADSTAKDKEDGS